MTDSSSQLLLQQHAARSRTAEDLQVFGKTAAIAWLSGKAENLSNAVVDAVKHAALSPEQVQRVIEFANTDAYLTEFKKEGRAHRVVDFPGGPADPATVLGQLNSGAGGAGRTVKTASYDYASPPKQASADIDFRNAWHRPAPSGTTSIPYENPLAEVYNLRAKLAGACEHIRGDLNFVESAYRESSAALVEEIKQAALNGVPLSEVVRAMTFMDSEGEALKLAFAYVAPELIRSRVFTPETMDQSFCKVASRDPINTQHPLLVAFGVYKESLEKAAELHEKLAEYVDGIDELDAYIKIANSAENVAHAAAEAAPSVWKALSGSAGKAVEQFKSTKGLYPAMNAAARELAPAVGNAVRTGAGHLAGPDSAIARHAGTIAEFGTKHAPTIGTGIGAWQVYRRPEVRQAIYDVNSHINPLSRAYDERQYALDNGMI